MTASPQVDPVLESASAEPDGRVPQWLVVALRDLADQAFDKHLSQRDEEFPEPDRSKLRARVVGGVVEDGPVVFTETRDEIEDLKQARTAAFDHENPPPPAGLPDVRDKRAHAAMGVALWLGMIFPLAFWQLLQAPLSPAGHFWVSAALVVVGFAMLRPAYVITAAAGRRLSGVPARGGAGWPLGTAVASAYLILLWRLWTSSHEAMGSFLAGALWVITGLVALVLTFGAFATAYEPTKEEGSGLHRIPGKVVGREIRVAVVAFGLVGLVLTGVVPVPGPEWVTWLAADVLSLVAMVLGGPLVLRARLPKAWSRDVTLRDSRGWKKKLAQLTEDRDKAMAAWRKAADEVVRRLVEQHVDAVRDPAFTIMLPSYGDGALGHMRTGKPIARKTAAGRKLERVLAGFSGGAVGVAGPRGSGKSTWLEAFRAGKLQDFQDTHIALLESVPVRYDVRDFVLYLYARMCREVIAFCKKRGADDADSPGLWPIWRARLGRWWPFAAIGVAWLVLGLAGSLSLRDPKVDVREWLTSLWWPVVSLFAVGGSLAVAIRRRPAAPPAPAPSRPDESGSHDLPALWRTAVDRLEEIEFQQKHTTGWSGKVGLPAGAELERSGSREVTRQPLTYPQIVREFGEFLKITVSCLKNEPGVATPSVVIILDELDKIATPEAAQDFVNEIKALVDVGVEGFLLLVSVSEDALASFERRGLPVRDAFDSTFDVILRLEHLTLGEARELLRDRVLGLPEPFACLAHCLAGGLPRELIRVTREMIRDSGSLPDVARRMAGGELRNQLSALRTVIAGGTYDDVLVSDLVRHVDAHAIADPAVLLRAVRQPPVTAGAEAELVPLYRLQLETLGYLYYLATILEVFGAAFSPADLERGRAEGDASFDTLSSVRQLFAVNARLAWLTVSGFREAWGLETVQPPG